MPTIKSLVEKATPVRWHCPTCDASGPADLSAIALAKGEDFDLMDCTPRCRVPDCLGLVWFSVPIGAWQDKMLTKKGDDRLFKHGDWVFAERMRLRQTRTDTSRSVNDGADFAWPRWKLCRRPRSVQQHYDHSNESRTG